MNFNVFFSSSLDSDILFYHKKIIKLVLLRFPNQGTEPLAFQFQSSAVCLQLILFFSQFNEDEKEKEYNVIEILFGASLEIFQFVSSILSSSWSSYILIFFESGFTFYMHFE